MYKSKNERKKQQKATFKKAGASVATTAAASKDTGLFNIQTYEQATGAPIGSFQELLRRPVPLAEHTNAAEAFTMADYARHALLVMETAVQGLVVENGRGDGASKNHLRGNEREQLCALRSTWADHLRAYKYHLWYAPPLGGGLAASYSLAVQLWLLIAHANVILQQSGAVEELFSFYPPGSAYLSRNRLVLDNGPLCEYSMRTLIMTIENFVARLDVLDRLHAEYTYFVAALEHCVANFICFTGDAATFDAEEWCTKTEQDGAWRCSEKFLTHSLVWFATLYDYAENWCALNQINGRAVRVSAHVVREAAWFPPASSFRSQNIFLCRFSKDLTDEVWRSAQRDFVRQFQLRPCDMDLYRVTQQMNEAHIDLVRTHKFDYRSDIAHAYLYHVHFDRIPYEYIAEALQWRYGDPHSTRSASLGVQWYLAQMGVLFIWHQFMVTLCNKFEFKHRCMLFQRDPAFASTLIKIRTFTYPVIVQQFARFSVFVPAHPPRCPHERVYDCVDMFEALAVWSVWVMRMCRGKIDHNVDVHVVLNQIYGERQMAQCCGETIDD